MTPTPAGKWDLLLFFEEFRPQIHDMIVDELQEKRAIKWYCVSKIRFSRETPEEDVEYCTPYFRSKVVIELDTSMIGDHIEQAFDNIEESLDEYLKKGSGWVFDSVIHMELKTATYHPLAPSSYIPLPSKLAAKKAVINIKTQIRNALSGLCWLPFIPLEKMLTECPTIHLWSRNCGWERSHVPSSHAKFPSSKISTTCALTCLDLKMTRCFLSTFPRGRTSKSSTYCI
ncbi:hypothetical protein AVEN_53105-1 [Araneus ventricosus]|uniref:Uncharacterized protein n=1 Tax=Araneus ventricosus TaxID=182803 RepID=A0A4Y2B7C2_ARAVE|nr:hypothetical protein AVEN_53105-1 [Araneus ventricosus]